MRKNTNTTKSEGIKLNYFSDCYLMLIPVVLTTKPCTAFAVNDCPPTYWLYHSILLIISIIRSSEICTLILCCLLQLFKLPAFSDLLTQYTERSYRLVLLSFSSDAGCFYLLIYPSRCYFSPFLSFDTCYFSGGQELENLILSDLFYHIQGELNGRQIDNRPFKELLQFLIDSRFLDAYKYEKDDDLPANDKSVYLYDTVRLKIDLGLEMWDLLAWKESKDLVKTMLLSLQDANSRMLHSTSKLSALRGLVTLLYMRQNNVSFRFIDIKILRR